MGSRTGQKLTKIRAAAAPQQLSSQAAWQFSRKEATAQHLSRTGDRIPQGSRLGPLLFIIYINDITEEIESDILIFADDTSLFASGKDPSETAEILNKDLEKLDGVGPADNRPSTDKLHHFVQKKNDM